MSVWTSIRGTIEVNPLGRTQAEKRYILETVLAHLPVITGSEADMQVYVVQPKGFDHSSNVDEFGFRTNLLLVEPAVMILVVEFWNWMIRIIRKRRKNWIKGGNLIESII